MKHKEGAPPGMISNTGEVSLKPYYSLFMMEAAMHSLNTLW